MANNFIGTAPDQVSVNGMLGSLAFQDATSVMLGKMAAGTVSTANFIRFPNTTVVISAVSNTAITTVGSENHNIGIVGEGVADPNNSTVWGVGVYGKAYTNGATRSGAVTGESHVTNSADTGSAIGVRGYAFDSHTGGLNVGLYGDAANSSVGNYALAMNNGNILSNFSQTWNSPGLFFNSPNAFANTANTTTITTSQAPLTFAQINSTRILVANTTASTIFFTLPAGTVMDAGLTGIFPGGSPINTAFEWSVYNIGSSNTVTMQTGTGHTFHPTVLAGTITISAGAAVKFCTIKQAANVFMTFKVAG